MPSFRNLLGLLLPITLSLAATTTAATCPQNWLENTSHGDTKCCYGNMVIEDRDAYCCVYDMTPNVETSSVSATTTKDDYDSWSTAGDCFTKIPFTASDYSDQVSSASSKIAAARTIATNEATSTSASSSSTSGTSSGSSSNTSSNTVSGSAASTTNAAMPIATAQELVLGGAAVVVGLFVL